MSKKYEFRLKNKNIWRDARWRENSFVWLPASRKATQHTKPSILMFIEEIIIDGFKSYATRTVVSGFDPNFNAITGLNGSGKSNILDSICFVLGISNLSQVLYSINLILYAIEIHMLCESSYFTVLYYNTL